MKPSIPDKIPTEHIKSMDKLENFYWWHQNRIKIATSLLSPCALESPRILDLGSGTGNFAVSLGERIGARKIVGMEISPTAIDYCKTKNIDVETGNLDTPHIVQEGQFDLVTAMDVIEHMENDMSVFEMAYMNLRPNGYFLVSTPAYNFLFSDWDRMLSHFRRYTRKSIQASVEAAGKFEIIRNTYAFSYVLLPATFRKLFSNKHKPAQCEFPKIPEWLNRLLLVCGALETYIVHKANLPAGLSVFLLLKKPSFPEQ